ncbi:esterase FE4-like [Manduca sexta]|uniref:esterase FE4-like n=1 Tax=Manduca sexta TaxID=7130 RepID=UPI00188DEBAD|nr:esterase FE4-like [Manduca sexta]
MIILSLMCIVSSVYCDSVSVSTNQGTLIGRKNKTENGVEYNEFLQIPFAKPPVGNLRFKSPQPPESWKAKEMPEKPMRTIYVPNLTSSHNVQKAAKIACTSMSLVRFQQAKQIVSQIVVFINYRLGVFGFLSLDIPEAAGNMGLKDQLMALKWVQENIEHFGGDKDNVTIMGLSAGSASVEYHILSPVSKGLFSKAIMQSGSALNHWAINHNIKNLSMTLVRELGYKASEDNDRAIYQFILNTNAIDLLTASIKVTDPRNFNGLFFGFVPSIEKDFGTGETF